MRANPGGTIPPSEVIGRDHFIESMWRILQRQSVVLSAERRLGKTCIVRKMAQEQQDRIPVYRDLEKVHGPLEFVEIVYQDAEAHLSQLKRAMVRVLKFLSHLQGAEVRGVIKFPAAAAPHWKTILTQTIEDLMEHQQQPAIFFWDELPLMLHNIKQVEGGERAAMELLDLFRALRQTYPALRMVFTGSIGLHNVLSSLRRAGYANDPTNDMFKVDLPPLEPDAAADLTSRLLDGEGLLPQRGKDELVGAIVSCSDRVPYFIHHLVDQLAQRGGQPDARIVEGIVETALTDPQDPWNLRYYRDRLDTYYADGERVLALGLLDTLATSAAALNFARLFDLVKAKVVTEDRELVLSVLTLLQRDHYVQQEADGAYRFRFPLIQRFWRLHRGLG